MIKSVIGVLLAASAFAPAMAREQQANVEARGNVQVDGQRDGDQARREAYRMQRQQQRGPGQAQQVQAQQVQAQQGQAQAQAQMQAQRQAQAQAQGAGQFRRDQQQGQYRQGQQFQQDQARQQDQYRQAQQDQYRQNQNQNRQGQYQGQRPDFGPNAPGGQGGYAGRGDQQGRPNPGQNGYAGRGNDGRGYDQRGYQDQRGFQQDGRGYQNNRGAWNNGWHGDNRYDWNRYRAQNRGAFHLPRYYAPGGGYGYRRYSVGITLGYGFYGQNYWIGNPYDYRLPPAYGPYRWVRYYNDALLVDVRSGYVVDAVYGIFW